MLHKGQLDGCYYVILTGTGESAQQWRHLVNDSKASNALRNETPTMCMPCYVPERLVYFSAKCRAIIPISKEYFPVFIYCAVRL